jgi:hypothetical protein
MSDRELMQQALKKLEFFAHMKSVSEDTTRLITALRERLAQPNRVWVGLEEEDLFDIASVNFGEPDLLLFVEMGKLVQKELKELNT